MALSVFEEIFAEEVKTDLRSRNDLVGYLANTSNSKEAERLILSGKSRMSDTVNWEHIATADTGDLVGSDGYLTTVATQATQSLSSEYPLPTGTQITGNFNRLAIATVKIPYAYRDFHSAGDALPSFLEEGCKQQIRDQIESFAFTEMWTDAAGDTGDTGFTFDTSSEANLQGDYEDISNFADGRNWEDERLIVALPSALKNAALPFSDFTSTDFNQALNPVAGGGLSMYNGWRHIYTNNATASQGVAFIPSAFALVIGGVQVEILKDKDERSDFMRVFVNFGGFSTRQTTTNDDATTTGSPVEGMAKLVIS